MVTAIMSNKTEIALNYLKHGFSVIPLSPKSKIPPQGFEWSAFQNRRASEEEVRRWFSENPDYNLGIVTGKISNLVVVDIEKDGETKGYVPTVMVKSGGGGFHMYYRYPSVGKVECKPRFRELTDIKADGGYVVVPPSIHSTTGSPYEWLVSPAQATMVELPEELLKELAKNNYNRPNDLVRIAQGVSDGERNEAAAKFIGYLLVKSKEYEWETEIWPKVIDWNLKNNPPLEEKELRSVFDSIAKRESRERETEEAVEDESESSGWKKNQSDLIIELVKGDKDIILFHDDTFNPYVRLPINGHNEIISCKSNQFKFWIGKTFYDKHKKAANSDSINNALNVIKGEALFNGKKYELHCRVAMQEGAIWYDLSDEKCRAVKITEDGWEIVDSPPIIFRRFSHQKPHVEPIKGGSIEPLLDFMNIKDEKQKRLLTVCVISYFIPGYAHPVINIYGSHGSAKSTLFKIIKRLVDPSKINVSSFPQGEDSLVLMLAHHWCILFDNISYLSGQISDMLCKAVTGAGFSKRELYSDDSDIIHEFSRCLGINGVNLVASKPDLLDRSLLIELDRISSENRKLETQVLAEFEQKMPELLGSVFDIVSRAMKIKPEINSKELTRMADFAHWGCAISKAMGYPEEEFLEAYRDNIANQNNEVLLENFETVTIMTFMEDRDEWKGTASQLLDELKIIAVKIGINVNEKAFPKTANALSKRINLLKTNLGEAGIKVMKREEGRQRIIHLQQVGKSIDDIVVVASPMQNDHIESQKSLFNNDSNDGNDEKDGLLEGIAEKGAEIGNSDANSSLQVSLQEQEDNSGLDKDNNDNNDSNAESEGLLEEAMSAGKDEKAEVLEEFKEEHDIMDDLPF
jgi:hypothetical protein